MRAVPSQGRSVQTNNRAVTYGIPVQDFEDQPADSGIPNGWEEVVSGNVSISVTSNAAYNGSQSVKFDAAKTKFRAISPTGTYDPTTAQTGVALRKTSEQGGGALIGYQLYTGGASSGTKLVRILLRDGLQVYNSNGSRTTLTTNIDYGEWVYATIKDIDPSNNTYTVEWSTPEGDSGSQTGLSMINSMPSEGYDDIRLGVYEATGNADYITFG